MLADVDHAMGAIGMAQPEVERQIAMGRHQVRVVVHRAGVHLIAARRLDTDKGQAQAQAGNHQAAIAAHRVLLRRAPTLQHGLAIGFGQAQEQRFVLVQAQALVARAQVQAVEVVGHATEQFMDQSRAAVGQSIRQRIALGLQRAQDIQRRRRSVQADAVADATVTGRVVGQHQGDTFFRIRHPRQLDPAPRQFGDEIHALGRGAIAHHVGLAALAAPGQILEADRPADDAPVQLRQGNVHGQVAGPQALFAGRPAGLVVLGADRLDHRDIAPKRAQMRRLRAGLSKAGGVENDRRADLVQQVLDHRQAARLLQTRYRHWQRVKPRRLQTLAEHIDKAGIGRLQVGAIEQHRRHRPLGAPIRLPIAQAWGGVARVINRRARQGVGLGPGIVTAQVSAGQAAIEIQRIAQPALAQELPQAVALFGVNRAQAAELRVRAIIPRHQNQRHPTLGQLHQALDAIAPVTDTAVQRNQNDFCVAQYLVDVQVHRGMVLHLHGVGQAQAGVVVGQLPGCFGQ